MLGEVRGWAPGAAIAALAVAILVPASGAVGSTADPPVVFAGVREDYPWAKRIEAARRYANDRRGLISFAVVDEDGRLRGDHVDRVHHSASVVKAMFLAAYLREPGVRDRDLRQSDRDLLGPMIKRSDNGTATTVYNKVGDDALWRLAHDARMRRFRPDATWGLSEITPSDQARFFSRYERHVPRRHRRYAMGLLKKIVPSQRWGIPPVAPRGWSLHFKGGWSPSYDSGWRVNQVMLLRDPPRRFSLAILTRFNPSFSYGRETIREVARRLLRHYNRFPRR